MFLDFSKIKQWVSIIFSGFTKLSTKGLRKGVKLNLSFLECLCLLYILLECRMNQGNYLWYSFLGMNYEQVFQNLNNGDNVTTRDCVIVHIRSDYISISNTVIAIKWIFLCLLSLDSQTFSRDSIRSSQKCYYYLVTLCKQPLLVGTHIYINIDNMCRQFCPDLWYF